MKCIQPVPALLLLTVTIFYISCSKEKFGDSRMAFSPPSPTSPTKDSLSGQEFIFPAKWYLWSDAMGDEIYVTLNPSGSFSITEMATLNREVFIQLDSTNDWIPTPQWNWYPNNYSSPPGGFFWSFPHFPYTDNQYFIVDNYPLNYELIGKPVKVKVKFI